MSNKTIIASGKRKTAVARATVREGKGIVKVNNVPIDVLTPKVCQLRIKEPVILAGESMAKIDIDVNVSGGGQASQADAARLAVGKGIIAFTKDSKLKKEFIAYDRNLLVADVRRKEPAKPNRHSQARAKRQKSYR